MLSNIKKHKEIKFQKISFNNVIKISRDKLVNKKNSINNCYAFNNDNINNSIQNQIPNILLKNNNILENKILFKSPRKIRHSCRVVEQKLVNIISKKNSKKIEEEKNDGTKEFPINSKFGLEKEEKKNTKNNNFKRCKTFFKKSYIKAENDQFTKRNKKETKNNSKNKSPTKNNKSINKSKEVEKIDSTINKIKRKFLCCFLT